MARFVFRVARAPFQSSTAEWAQRFPSQDAHRGSCRWRFVPGLRDKRWKWLVRCGRQLFAHAKYIQRTGAAAKYRESIRQQPAPSACSRCESCDTPHAARPAQKSTSLRHRRQAAREGNRLQEKRSRYYLRVFRDSDLQFHRSTTQPWRATEIPAKQFHADAARYTCTPRRCEFYLETLRFAEAREYSRC